MGRKRKVAVLPALKKAPIPKAAKKPKTQSKEAGLEEVNSDSVLISKFHVLQKNLVLAQELKDEKQIAQLRKEMEALGGLSAYQSASLRGETRGGFNSSNWVLEFLFANHSILSLPSVAKLLDVGAIIDHYPRADPRVVSLPCRLVVTSIDVNPLSPDVIKADFFDYASSLLADPTAKFDIVVLSLVVNFVGDPWKRGLMLSLAARLLHPGGLLFLVLPSACVLNSRFLNEPLLTRITTALGLSLVPVSTAIRVTSSLWMGVYVASETSQLPMVSPLRKRNEVRVGPGNFNNFAILLGQRQSLPTSGKEGTLTKKTTSNQRKKARRKKVVGSV